DTGCTAHMTPIRTWFRTYAPHRVPIELADATVIYSAGIGSVEFVPRVNGKECSSVVFHDVLHVPDLSVNLFSVFHI
ncbi:hypothetical protein EXIGLDRAFT_585325, partial [Exidia glandulosa HHB12029]